ncbi:hypothetical protein RclHR1_24620004 [Rhizophagus clarus]|uniref:RRM domain-containing protein n=1 Tax=Rhizophagus clarus TaxID=94130 RepID=A0A2Z6QZF3_9GLOM|nr:hypothetical protein RclHR1_24620004 [Rhizophagus clarus]
MSYFKKFGNIASCRVYSRKNAKVTPCHYTVDQKSSRREFVTTLTQLPPNTKDIDLAPLTRDLGAKAVNVPLSLHSYKPKRWAYVMFNFQETMDAAIEQIISFQGHTLQWNFPNDTNKLCHRCGKLGCAPNQCPSCQNRGRTRDKNPVAALKERFNINQPIQPRAHFRSTSRSRSRSKGPDNSHSSHLRQASANTSNANTSYCDHSKSNDHCDRLVSFSIASRTSPLSISRDQPLTISPQEATNILSLLKALQQDMADVCDRITALELNDRRMTRIEQHLGLLPPPDISPNIQTSDMLIDPLIIPDPIVTYSSSRPAAPTLPAPLNPLQPSFTPSSPAKAPSLHPQLLLSLIVPHQLLPLTRSLPPPTLAMRFRLLMQSIQP